MDITINPLKRSFRWLGMVCLILIMAGPVSLTASPNMQSQDISLLEAIELLSEKYHVYFTYDRTIVSDVIVSYDKDNHSTVNDELQDLLKETDLNFQIFETQFVILYKKDEQGLKSLRQMKNMMEGILQEEDSKKKERKDIVRDTRRTVPILSRSLDKSLAERRVVMNVSGTVTDAQGVPLIGVNILVKGTGKGTTTDLDGQFLLNDISEQAVLVLSYIGYQSTEIPVNGQTILTIIMQDDIQTLDEVVVVGYGTQKKVNLTGSLTTINEKDIDKIKVSQPSQLLAGLSSGLTVTQSSGQPGKDGASLRIRGLGTFSSAGTSPLVLIDGISSDLNNINANDIESISILKDAASAAIYGTRAANGVILIETKKGKEGTSSITYRANAGFQRPSEIPKIVDSWVYAEMINEALQNVGSNRQYTDEEIARFKSGEDQDNYPNKRHYDDLITSGSGFQTEHYLNFSGGNNQNSYLFSVGYLDQNGFISETNHNHYNILFNASSKIADNFKLNVKFQGRKGSTSEPTNIRRGDGADALLDYALKIPNTIAGKKSDGYYGQQTGFTVEGWLDSEAFIENTSSRMNTSAGFEWDILSGLRLTGLAGFNYDNVKDRRFWPVLVVDPSYTESPSELTETRTENSLMTLQSFLNYEKAINNHNLNFLLGFSQESNVNSWLQSSRDNFPSNTLHVIGAGAPANQLNSGSGSEWALQSVFSRINYIADNKYLFEINARYDGSSRFPKANRWSLFPSVSAGWIVSEEAFFDSRIINHIKLRGSWGQLGNQNIGNYPYQQILSLGVNAPFGRQPEMHSGAAATIVPSTDITWESTRIVNFGLDLGLYEGKLNGSIDVYDKLTSDILYNITASDVLGLTPSVQNAGIVSNKGIDFNLQHRNYIGDFSYDISGNISYVKNEVKELATVIQDVAAGLFVGHSLQSIYGYVADGLFIDQQDVENYASQPRTAMPGDIKLIDISGPDGVPDGIVNPEYDRMIIGNRFPKYSYGLSIAPRYKNFDLYINMYGLAGRNSTLGGFANNAFYQGSNPQEWMLDRWTKENPNPNAAYPRFLVVGGGEQQFYTSTFIMQDASFLRINNLQLGYTFPKNVLGESWISDLYVYVNVKNPFMFDKFRQGWDAEMSTGYPAVRYFNAGFNVKL